MSEITIKKNSLTYALAGKTYEYIYSSGMSVCLSFTKEKANWKILAGTAKGASGSNDYLARLVADDTYFIQWNEPEEKITVTLLINEKTKKIYGSAVYPEEVEFDVANIHKSHSISSHQYAVFPVN